MAMRRITKRDLNHSTAKVLESADAGETIVITERGVPRWRIESLGPNGETLGGLTISRPASKRATWLTVKRAKHKVSTKDMLESVREDRA